MMHPHIKRNSLHVLSLRITSEYHLREWNPIENLEVIQYFISKLANNFVKKITLKKQKHSENVDTSTSVTFDFDVWFDFMSRSKKSLCQQRCRLLYCTLPVPGNTRSGMMSVRQSVIVCEIRSLVHSLCSLTFTYDLLRLPRSLSLKSQINVIFLCIGTKYEVCMFNRI